MVAAAAASEIIRSTLNDAVIFFGFYFVYFWFLIRFFRSENGESTRLLLFLSQDQQQQWQPIACALQPFGLRSLTSRLNEFITLSSVDWIKRLTKDEMKHLNRERARSFYFFHSYFLWLFNVVGHRHCHASVSVTLDDFALSMNLFNYESHFFVVSFISFAVDFSFQDRFRPNANCHSTNWKCIHIEFVDPNEMILITCDCRFCCVSVSFWRSYLSI